MFLIAIALIRSARSQNACTFSGPPREQARCLLRHVKPYAEVDRAPITLPESLNRLIGEPTNYTVTKEALVRYLNAHGIDAEDIGGSVSASVSRTSTGRPAAYFIIHDTSTPTLERGQAFPPAGMDTVAWEGNKFESYLCLDRNGNRKAGCEPVAHVFINRLGESRTGHNFSQGWRSTRYEGQSLERRGLFLAVENIQPRRKDRNGIDAEAPNHGFTDAQLDRLALVT